MEKQTQVRETRETVEDDYRYEYTNGLLDTYNVGRITLAQVAARYNYEFPTIPEGQEVG